MTRANSKKSKIMKALNELVSEGKKVSPFAVEKRAGVSNGLVRHYEDVMEMINQAKLDAIKQPVKSKSSNATLETLKSRLKKAQEKAKKQEQLKQDALSEVQRLKKAEKSYADTIAQLTWDLHRELSKANPRNVFDMNKK
jgi:hypothetical protein|tara:strand:+ start:3387 stop:3806 length:420 start_codon:yes stop_codon:yes gene_type:complete